MNILFLCKGLGLVVMLHSLISLIIEVGKIAGYIVPYLASLVGVKPTEPIPVDAGTITAYPILGFIAGIGLLYFAKVIEAAAKK